MGASLLLVIVAAVTLEATGFIQYLSSQRELKQEASRHASSELDGARNEIMDVINQAEAAVRNSLWIARWCLETPDSLVRIPQRVVADNPVVAGSTMALVPGYWKKHPLYAPYFTREAGSGALRELSLATEAYDYPAQAWFAEALERGEGYWSEPYFDEGGGELLMTTYSMPLRDRNGDIAAVLTADVSLDWLRDVIGHVKGYPGAFSMIVSRTGRIMVSPVQELVMSKTITQYAAESSDSTMLAGINRQLMSGATGEEVVRYKDETYHVYYAPVERTGWSMCISLPEKELYAGVRKVGVIVLLLQLLGLILLAYMLREIIRNLQKYQRLNEQKERMQSELRIGHNIQMAMIPKTFPPFPERSDLDFVASIVPAKEVGGDLYDYYIRDEKLLFCIGDVSGKGVPASLVMAVTRSLFRAMSAHEFSPARIVTSMNDSMSETNENSMFVTFFCGVLDLATGRLRYCNAGHNPPLLFTNTIRKLPVVPNLPLGVMQGMNFQEQAVDLAYDDALFLYTDGLTEAENAAAEQFGFERMEAVLHIRRSGQEHLDALREAVGQFVGDAPQSDDQTMLFLHYLGHVDQDRKERHLLLRNDIQQIPQLADFVGSIADEMQLSQHLALNLNLALEEAVTNVILYAYPKGSEGLVEVEAILRKDALKFIISDGGMPFDPTTVPPVDVTLDAEDRPVGGLGIHLVRKLMDAVRYERRNGKNILSMTKNL